MKINNKKKINLTEEHIIIKSFLGNLIKKGNFSNSINILIYMLEYLKKTYKFEGSPKNFLKKVLLKLKPIIGIRIKKVAGIMYQLPSPLSENRSTKIAIKWLFSVLENRNENAFVDRLKGEISDIIKNKSLSLNKKITFEKIALENRIFLFFLKK